VLVYLPHIEDFEHRLSRHWDHLNRAKWKVWHGNLYGASIALSSFYDGVDIHVMIAESDSGRSTIAKQVRERLVELWSYLTANQTRLINYGREYRKGRRVSTARKESTVDQASELKAAQDLARAEAAHAEEAEKRAKEQRQSANKLRLRAWIAAGIAMVAVIFAGAVVVVWQKSESNRAAAEEQERVAESERFHNESSSALDRFPGSLLLAVDASNVGAPPDGVRVTAVEQAFKAVLASAGGQTHIINPSPTKAVGISPHSHYLVIAKLAGPVKSWDLPAIDPAAMPVVLHGEGSAVNAVRISLNNHWLAVGRGNGKVAIWDAVDANHAYVLDDHYDLWLESRPVATIPPTRQQVDGNVASFEAVDTNSAYVLGTDGKLWLEHGPFNWVPPTRQQVDVNVASFEAVDTNSAYVLGTDGKLWLEHGPFNSDPPTRQQVDGDVASFDAVDENNVYVVINGDLWLEHGPLFNRVSATQIDADVAAFGVIDANTILVFERDGALWLEHGPFGMIPPHRDSLNDYVEH
jgi:hypothetical protein